MLHSLLESAFAVFNCRPGTLDSVVLFLATDSAKLKYLDAILSSYITLGKANLQCGDARETERYLKPAHNMAKLLKLSVR